MRSGMARDMSLPGEPDVKSHLPFAGGVPAPGAAESIPDDVTRSGSGRDDAPAPVLAPIGSALDDPAPATLAALASPGFADVWSTSCAPAAPDLPEASEGAAGALSGT